LIINVVEGVVEDIEPLVTELERAAAAAKQNR
jgi:hypothetical protein